MSEDIRTPGNDSERLLVSTVLGVYRGLKGPQVVNGAMALFLGIKGMLEGKGDSEVERFRRCVLPEPEHTANGISAAVTVVGTMGEKSREQIDAHSALPGKIVDLVAQDLGAVGDVTTADLMLVMGTTMATMAVEISGSAPESIAVQLGGGIRNVALETGVILARDHLAAMDDSDQDDIQFAGEGDEA